VEEVVNQGPPDIYAVLLAGGSGSRLWPVSRQLYPKQLVKFTGNYSLVQNTIKRLAGVVDPAKVRIVCGQEHFDETARHMAELGLVGREVIICEPCGRNTAPAVLLAILKIRQAVPDAVLLVFPADHVIEDTRKFHDQLQVAIGLACKGHIVTFGIRPSYPETGYGYIEGAHEASDGALYVKRFVEKPDQATAQAYLTAGNFFWNSGMFAFGTDVVLKEFETHATALYQSMRALIDEKDLPDAEGYRALPNISIDCAIMEKTDKIVVLPSAFGWSDIGSWKALYDFLPKDENDNVIDGDVIANDTRRCFVMGRERLIATHALRDLVVVETPDAVFVSDLNSSRDVKGIVEQLKQSGRSEYNRHNTTYHVWGSATLLEEQGAYRVRCLTVYPGASLEVEADPGGIAKHVTMVQGSARVTINAKVRTYPQGSHLAIAPEQAVTVSNVQTDTLHLIEITV
jgi:mannose-1-phosphate guanylyltransferase